MEFKNDSGHLDESALSQQNVEQLLRSHKLVTLRPQFRDELLAKMLNQSLQQTSNRRTTLKAALILFGLLGFLAFSANWQNSSPLLPILEINGTDCWRSSASSDEWQALPLGQHPIILGDQIFSQHPQQLAAVWPDGARLDVEGESLLMASSQSPNTSDPKLSTALLSLTLLSLTQGSATLSTHKILQTLDTPVGRISARHAELHISLSTSPPFAPLKRKTAMKRTLAASIITGGIIIATIAVINSKDEGEVKVTRPGQDDIHLQGGDVAVIGSDGTASISSAQDRTTASANKPLPIAIEQEQQFAIRGQVLGPDQQAVAQAKVVFTSIGSEGQETIIASADSDAEGTYLLKLPMESIGNIRAEKERYESTTVEWKTENNESLVEVEGQLSSAESIDVALLNETAIAGRIFSASDNIDTFMITTQKYFDQYRVEEPKVHRIESADGQYYIASLKPGKYHIWAYSHGYSLSKQIDIKLASNELIENLDMELSPGTSISGQVFDKKTGRPIPGVIVYPPIDHLLGTVNILNRKDVDESVRNASTTDDSGSFSLADIKPGRVLVRALHPEYMPQERWLNTTAEGLQDIEFAMQPGTAFHGKVLNDQGQPSTLSRILAVTLTLDPKVSIASWGEVDSSGSYKIKNLRPGGYVLIFLLNDGQGNFSENGIKMETLGSTQDRQVDFMMEPTLATLKGRVTNTQGEALQGIGVTAFSSAEPGSENWSFETGSTDADGYYEISNLKFGKYSISLALANQQSFAVQKSVELLEAIDYQEDFEFVNREIKGSLSTAGGKIVTIGEVFALRQDSEGRFSNFAGRGIPDEKGEFALPGLLPGTYIVSARSPGYQFSSSRPIKIASEQTLAKVVKIRLERGASITIKVVDNNGKPLSGVIIRLLAKNGTPANPGINMQTDFDGNYKYASLTPGPYSAQALVKGKVMGSAEISAQLDANNHAQIVVATTID